MKWLIVLSLIYWLEQEWIHAQLANLNENDQILANLQENEALFDDQDDFSADEQEPLLEITPYQLLKTYDHFKLSSFYINTAV